MSTPNNQVLSRLTIAVVEPEFGLNLGYVARTMANFGLTKLVVIAPTRLTKECKREARKFSSHGSDIIDNISYAKSLKVLRRKFRLLVGTTAIEGTRKANLTRKTLDLDRCAARLKKRIEERPSDACIVLGRDTTGMTNEELQCCDYNMTVRASAEYNTLNVSHALAIILYAFSKTLKRERRETRNVSSRKVRQHAISLFEQLAELSDFQSFKSELLREAMSRMFDRADPSLRETYLLMGLASKAVSKLKRSSIPRQ